jgi:hypothetical protein
MEGLRGAQAAQIADIQTTFDAERQASVGRIREVESELEALRVAQAAQIADMKTTAMRNVRPVSLASESSKRPFKLGMSRLLPRTPFLRLPAPV